MIEAKIVKLSREDWPDEFVQACSALGFCVVNDHVVQELKARLSSRVEHMLIEYPYRDIDYSSTYSIFHTKKHRRVSRESLRVHFFGKKIKESDYYGFMTLRPSLVEQRGRSHISPSALQHESPLYIVTTNDTAHLYGHKLNVESFPWMAQETDISVCAHVAIWSVINYYACKYSRYRRFTIAELAQSVSGFFGRTVPSEGLNLLQISELLSSSGFFPLLLKKNLKSPYPFFQAAYAYIESGIPVIGVMTQKEHAVVIIGHGPLRDVPCCSEGGMFHWSIDYIDDLIISNDHALPFTKISRKRDGQDYSFEDLDFIVIPLYEKMYLNANVVIERIKSLSRSGVLDIPQNAVCRPYLTSARSLKRYIYADNSMNQDLKEVILKLPTPQFVWCADFVMPADQFSNTYSKVIIDSTAGTYEEEPWLLMHDEKNIIYYDRDADAWYKLPANIEPYVTYRNNLKEYSS